MNRILSKYSLLWKLLVFGFLIWKADEIMQLSFISNENGISIISSEYLILPCQTWGFTIIFSVITCKLLRTKLSAKTWNLKYLFDNQNEQQMMILSMPPNMVWSVKNDYQIHTLALKIIEGLYRKFVSIECIAMAFFY